MEVFKNLVYLVHLQVVDVFVKVGGFNTFFTLSTFTFMGYWREKSWNLYFPKLFFLSCFGLGFCVGFFWGERGVGFSCWFCLGLSFYTGFKILNALCWKGRILEMYLHEIRQLTIKFWEVLTVSSIKTSSSSFCKLGIKDKTSTFLWNWLKTTSIQYST